MDDHSTGDAGPASAYCSGCGNPATACAGCGRALDPPRFCTRCARRLTVAVSPGGYRASCRDHGPVPAPSAT
jgi:hypothetical protein